MNIVIADLNNRGIYRPVDEIYGKYKTNDTGLCNRLLYWELCKIINYLNDDKFNVVIDDEQNPETKNCFDLPNTIVTDARNIDFDNYLPITNKMVDDIINNGYKLEDGNYYTDFTYRQIRDINIEFKKRFIRDLKFKIKEINENINQIVRGCIGIHLRRGRGVKINKGTTIDLSLFEGWDHEILSEYIQMKIKDMPAWQFYQWEYTKDDVYFKIIDLILSKSPNQKFYISSDLDDKFIEHWKTKYPNKILSKSDFYENIKGYELPINVHVKNFLDLYCLSNTRQIFRIAYSTWSDFASDYNHKDGIFINLDDIESEILSKCIKKI